MVQFLGLKTRQHIIVFYYRNLENGEMKPPCGQNFMWPVFKKKITVYAKYKSTLKNGF